MYLYSLHPFCLDNQVKVLTEKSKELETAQDRNLGIQVKSRTVNKADCIMILKVFYSAFRYSILVSGRGNIPLEAANNT